MATGRWLLCSILKRTSLTYRRCWTLQRSLASSSSTEYLDFKDTKRAFANISDQELQRAYFVYKIFQYDSLVDRSQQLLNLLQRVLGKGLFRKLMRATLFGQFVAGEDRESLRPVLARYRSQGVRPMLAYSAEDDVTEKDNATKTSTAINDEKRYDTNVQYTVDCINTAADNSKEAICATKITGLGRTEVLLRWSQVLVGSENMFTILADVPSLLNGHITIDSFGSGLQKLNLNLTEAEIDKLWKNLKWNGPIQQALNLFEWKEIFTQETELYLSLANKYKLPVMDDGEQQEMNNIIRRMEILAETAQQRGVKLNVDAEQTYYQPAIRHITVYLLMPKYNMKSPVIYNTQQCYLKEAFDRIQLDIAASKHYGCFFGVKTVRGAYMDSERALAKEKGYEDPIWSTKAETNASYHRVLDIVMKRVKEGRVNVMVATHNEDTIHYAIDKINTLGLNAKDGSVVFGQVFGMSDHLTLTLGSHGYMAYKYMLYGPVEEVLPYLVRRAYENRGMFEGALRERGILRKELMRRRNQ